MSFSDYVKEGERNEDDFEYTTVNKSGKSTESPDQITKVIATLRAQKAGAATRLANEFELILKEKEDIDSRLDLMKDKARHFVEELFSTSDALWTRVLETARVTLSLSKDTVRNNKKFNEDLFIKKILGIMPDLADKVEQFRIECTEISSSVVKSSITPKIKTEGFEATFNKLVGFISKIANGFKKWLPMYDKKLYSIEGEIKKLDVATESTTSLKSKANIILEKFAMGE